MQLVQLEKAAPVLLLPHQLQEREELAMLALAVLLEEQEQRATLTDMTELLIHLEAAEVGGDILLQLLAATEAHQAGAEEVLRQWVLLEARGK